MHDAKQPRQSRGRVASLRCVARRAHVTAIGQPFEPGAPQRWQAVVEAASVAIAAARSRLPNAVPAHGRHARSAAAE